MRIARLARHHRVVQVQGAAGAVHLGVPVDRRLVRPRGRRAGGRSLVGPARFGQVRRVWLPVGQVQVPVVLVGVPADPVQPDPVDVPAVLVVDLVGGTDRLAEVAEEVVGAVALGEHRDGCGVVAVPLQPLPEKWTVGMCAVARVEPEPGRLPEVADHAVGDAELPAGQCGPRRQAGGVGAVVPLEGDALVGESLQVRGQGALVSVRHRVVRPQRIHVDIDDAHGVLLYGWRTHRKPRLPPELSGLLLVRAATR
jgi:hypothetical protein